MDVRAVAFALVNNSISNNVGVGGYSSVRFDDLLDTYLLSRGVVYVGPRCTLSSGLHFEAQATHAL